MEFRNFVAFFIVSLLNKNWQILVNSIFSIGLPWFIITSTSRDVTGYDVLVSYLHCVWSSAEYEKYSLLQTTWIWSYVYHRDTQLQEQNSNSIILK